jgi:hypothetical protein
VHGAGCVITAGILGSGFSQFKAGNKKASQFFMRARVVAQARLSVHHGEIAGALMHACGERPSGPEYAVVRLLPLSNSAVVCACLRAPRHACHADRPADTHAMLIESLVSVQTKRGKQTNKDKELTPDP